MHLRPHHDFFRPLTKSNLIDSPSFKRTAYLLYPQLSSFFMLFDEGGYFMMFETTVSQGRLLKPVIYSVKCSSINFHVVVSSRRSCLCLRKRQIQPGHTFKKKQTFHNNDFSRYSILPFVASVRTLTPTGIKNWSEICPITAPL